MLLSQWVSNTASLYIYRRQPSHVCLTKRRGEGMGEEQREAQINRQRKSKRNRRGKTGSTEGVSGER